MIPPSDDAAMETTATDQPASSSTEASRGTKRSAGAEHEDRTGSKYASIEAADDNPEVLPEDTAPSARAASYGKGDAAVP